MNFGKGGTHLSGNDDLWDVDFEAVHEVLLLGKYIRSSPESTLFSNIIDLLSFKNSQIFIFYCSFFFLPERHSSNSFFVPASDLQPTAEL